MRLFLAVEPDEAAQERLAHVQSDLQRIFGEMAGALRWTAPGNVHATLHFLGELDEPSAARLRNALGTTVACIPFEARAGRPEIFPHSGPARVLWLPVDAGRDELAVLHREIGARIQDAGFVVERRPYTPHLTLARVRDRERRRSRRLGQLLRDVPMEQIAWTVDRVTLFRSDLSGAAPRYQRLHQIQLA